MIGKASLKRLGLRSLKEYFGSITASFICGHISEAGKKYSRLSRQQKQDYAEAVLNEIKRMPSDITYHRLMKFCIEEIYTFRK